MSLKFKDVLTHDQITREVKMRDAVSVQKGTSIKQVLKEMRARKRGCALIMHGRKIAGIFTERDLLNRVIEPQLSLTTPIDQVMTPNPTVLKLDSSVAEAIQLMSKGGYRHVPLVDKKGKIQYFVSVRDIIDYLADHFPYEVYNLPPDPHQINLAPEGA